MRVARSVWTEDEGWREQTNGLDAADAELVLIFGSTAALQGKGLSSARSRYPNAYVCGCSTAGEIAGAQVLDDSIVATAVRFDRTTFRTADVEVQSSEESYRAGEELGRALPHEGLVHAFVLSDGLSVNGTELVKGINSTLPDSVAVTGGLSGDGARFSETYVCVGGVAKRHRVLLLGFYGDALRVGYGSMGGWDPFGPERRITRAEGNVLYELDGRSALGLYKEYLGEHAAGLPASGLLFPLALRNGDRDGNRDRDGVVRTILAVNEEQQSMTFAGDIPVGWLARLMHANFDRLVDGAAGAAQSSRQKIGEGSPELALLISCVGRKLVLKQRIEEEVEAVLEVLGADTCTTGFYSYGEVSPLTPDARCALHNQTMTITTFTER